MFNVTVIAILLLIVIYWASESSHLFSLRNPFPTYAITFAIYHFAPLLVWSLREQPTSGYEWPALGLAVAAFISTAIGINFGMPEAVPKKITVSHQSERPTVILIILLVAATITNYGVRISRGAINTHVAYFSPSATTFDSIALVFTSQGKFAAIILLGYVASVCRPEKVHLYRRTLVAYTLALEAILLINSETRPMFTGLICFLLAWRQATREALSWRRVFGGVGAFILGSLVIQEVRMLDLNQILYSDNSTLEATRAVASGAASAANGVNTLAMDNALDRMTGGPRFAAEVWGEFATGAEYLKGRAFIHALRSAIPRVLMADKESVVPLDFYVCQQLSLAEVDSSLTSFAYMFVEGGWIAVCVGHLLIGAFLAFITLRAIHGGAAVCWLVCAFSWEVVLQMENEFIPESLSAIRAVAVYATGLWVISNIFANERTARPRMVIQPARNV